MRALITRPREDSTAIAEHLEELGIEPVIEPLMTVEQVADAKVDLDGVRAILLTSRNGVRALADATERRDIDVYAVGDSTAELARERGFESVESAGGDSESLADLVRQRLQPDEGTLLHAAGAAVAGDLAGVLTRDGYDVRRQQLYATRPSSALSVSTCGLMSGGGIELALFFSPRTAQIFVDLVGQAGLADACAEMTAVCLSQAVAQEIGALEWREVHTAGEPNLRSMIEVAASAGSDPEQTEEDSQDESNNDPAAAPPSSAMNTAPETNQPWGAGAAPAEPKRKSKSGAWIVAAVVVVAIAGVGIYAWPGISARLGLQPTAAAPANGAVAANRAALRELADRVSGIENALKALQSGPLAELRGKADETAAELPRLAQRIDVAEKVAAGAGASAGSSAAADERIAALERTIADLRSVMTSRMDGLDTRVAGLATGAADGATGTARLQAENDRLKSSLAAATLRLEALEAKAAEPVPVAAPQKGSALVLAVGQLREALEKSNPFPAPLESLRAVAGDDPVVADAVQVLSPLANTGVATRNRLVDTFDVAAAGAARAALAPAGAGWLDRTIQRLASVVTVRREGHVEGDTAQAVLARAEALVKDGDLVGADKALAGLEAEAAAAMAPWRAAVASRIAADGAIDKLGQHAIKLLAAES
jgi:uroporphyrinogen-III synthase